MPEWKPIRERPVPVPRDPPRNAGTAGNRIWILDDANHRYDSLDPENVAIFDDFIARGETMSRNARTVRGTNLEFDNIHVIALGKNGRRD